MMGNSPKTGGVLVTPPLKLHQHLDWIELTYPTLSKNTQPNYPEHWTTKAVETKPHNGYNLAFRYPDGRTEERHTNQKSMGIHVTMPAQTLAQLEEDEKWLLGYFLENGAKITRLDFALDVFEKPLEFNKLWKFCLAKEYECRLRQPPLRTHDAERGDTIYFGRMKSSVFTRVYNKAAEQKIDGSWVRVETVMRHQRANHAAKLYAGTDVEVASFITGHVQIKNFKWWTDVMTMKATKTRYDLPAKNSRREWLLKSVAPSLAREMMLDDSLYEDFIRHVDACYQIEREKSYRLNN